MALTLFELYQTMLKQMGPTGWWPADSKEQIMVEAILIQNTTQNNAENASNLFREATQYLPEKILALPLAELQELVRPAGFFKNKSLAIQNLFAWYGKYDFNPSKIEAEFGANLRQELLTQRGIGPETADVLLTYVFDQKQFIADKYARTLLTQLGIKGLGKYQDLAKILAKLPDPFSVHDAQEFHGLIDEFGKQYFHPVTDFQQSFLAGEKLEL